MSSPEKLTITDWKQLWQLVSGIHYPTPNETVKEKLLEVSEKLQDGLLQYKKCTTTSSELEAFLKKRNQEKLFPFTNKLQQFLDLNTEQCWDLLCYYLINEYRGSASSLTNFISTETNTAQLLSDIWCYYSLERLILLKIVKNILEFYKNSSNPYKNEYNCAIEKITLKKLKESYLKQLEYLIEENAPSKLVIGEFFSLQGSVLGWAERNAGEIIEVLHILTLIVNEIGCEGKELKRLVKCQQSYVKQQYLDISNTFHVELTTKIIYSEITLFLCCLDNSNEGHVAKLNAQEITEIEEKMKFLQYTPEYSPVLLSWMIFNIENEMDKETTDEYEVKIARLGIKHLKNVISNRMFQDESLISRIARLCTYNCLSRLCDLYDGSSICQLPFAYDLLHELVLWPKVANIFRNSELGAKSLYSIAFENFPMSFTQLSMIFCNLCKAGETNYINKELEKLFLKTDHNYFNVLHEGINLLIQEVTQYTALKEERLKHVISGVRFLAATLSTITNSADITEEMYFPIELTIDILNKLKNLSNPPIELLAICMEVCSTLLPFYEIEIFSRIKNFEILPSISNENLDYKKYANGVGLNSNLVGFYLMNIERSLEKYDFLRMYLKFLKTYAKIGANRLYSIEIPGLVFLLRDVFPHLHTWRFKTSTERNEIYSEIMGYICEILDDNSISMNSDRLILKNICIYSLLNLENGLILLRFIAIGNPSLKTAMENETNWTLVTPNNITFLVRLSMRILMRLLKLKPIMQNSSNLSPLEALIYTQPKQLDSLRIIPVVTSYMNNISDRWLPILSCRLLKRIALEFNMSILPCLDMEPEQIRSIFLQRLFDPLENDDLKIAILEFIEACIEKQPGLTEALFKSDEDEEKNSLLKDETAATESESVLTFMENYLKEVEKNPIIITAPHPNQIMSLFHALWRNNMQILVQKLMEKPTFWPNLCKPLFHQPLQNNIKIYSQLFNILGLELFCYNANIKFNSELKNVLNGFFERNHFDNYLNHLFNFPEQSIAIDNDDSLKAKDEIPEWLSRLQSFKDFTVIFLKKKVKGIELPDEKIKLLAKECLRALVDRSKCTDDLRPFIILSELYLIVILGAKHSYIDENMFPKVVELLTNLGSYYEDVTDRAKYSCLAIAIKCAELLSGAEISKDPELFRRFFNSIINITCIELNNLEQRLNDTLFRQNSTKPETLAENSTNTGQKSLVLCLNLLKTVITAFHNDTSSHWEKAFVYNKIFNRLLVCLGWVLPFYSERELSIELLDLIIVVARSNCSSDLLHCNVPDYLWLQLLPPKELSECSFTYNEIKNVNSWSLEKWWQIYSRGIELITILLQQHNYLFLNETMMFIGIHKEHFIEYLLLAKQTLRPDAVTLFKNVIELILEIGNYEKEWRIDHNQSFYNIIRCIEFLMYHCICLLYQPETLRRLTEQDSIHIFLIDDIVPSMNDLLEMITLCGKCLLKFSPSLLDLICEPEFLVTRWELLVEIQFDLPKLDAGDYPQLTFGSLLSAIGILTKSLNIQNYGFSEIPLNPRDTIDEQDSLAVSKDHERNISLLNRTPFSKSISVTSGVSISSTSAPSNEILSNLDSETCLIALEIALTLLASQSLLALKNRNLSPRGKQLIQTEISNELNIYHEFVRKKVITDNREHKITYYRKKHGLFMMQLDEQNSNNNGIDSRTTGATLKKPEVKRISEHKDSLRINALRNLHQKSSSVKDVHSSLNLSQPLSPIPGTAQKRSDLNAKPGTSTPISKTVIERVKDEEGTADTPLSHVQLVEEDFFHFMSILFSVICRSD